jgi:hypothetical protein
MINKLEKRKTLSFTERQDLANYLADDFNKHLRSIPHCIPSSTPMLHLLSCSVLIRKDPSWPTKKLFVLVEKIIDTNRFHWTKWNDNKGNVLGKR